MIRMNLKVLMEKKLRIKTRPNISKRLRCLDLKENFFLIEDKQKKTTLKP
jgi:hypothetical protein